MNANYYSNILKTITILLLTFCATSSSAQEVFSGKVIDSETKEPIPYCYIYTPNKLLVSITNNKGEFYFNMKYNSKKVIFYCMGYDSLAVSLEDSINDLISLSPNPYQIDEVVVTGKKSKTYTKNVKKHIVWPWKTVIKYYMSPGVIQTRLIKVNKRGYLKSIYVYVVDEKESKANFRIKIYKNDNGKPGKEITPDNIIAQGNPGNWADINVDSYRIIFPEEGLFIGIEWIQTNDNKPFTKRWGNKKNIVKTYYGPILGGIGLKNWRSEKCYSYSPKCNCWTNSTTDWSIPLIAAEVVLYKK